MGEYCTSWLWFPAFPCSWPPSTGCCRLGGTRQSEAVPTLSPFGGGGITQPWSMIGEELVSRRRIPSLLGHCLLHVSCFPDVHAGIRHPVVDNWIRSGGYVSTLVQFCADHIRWRGIIKWIKGEGESLWICMKPEATEITWLSFRNVMC